MHVYKTVSQIRSTHSFCNSICYIHTIKIPQKQNYYFILTGNYTASQIQYICFAAHIIEVPTPAVPLMSTRVWL